MSYRHTFMRTITNISEYADNTRQQVEEIKKKYEYDDTSPDGDVPIYPGFATSPVFWKIMGLSVIFGAVIGFLGLLYMNLINKVPEFWADMPSGSLNCKTAMEVYGFNAGHAYYVGVTSGAGLIVGLLRYIARVPNNQTGFFKEIKDGHVDLRVAPWTFLISTISLCGGANVGPEAALANLGGWFGCFTLKYINFDNPEDSKLLVLAGMSAALGCLFPFPMLACLLILELTDLPKAKQGMEAVIVLSFAAIVAFSTFYGIEPYTALTRVDDSANDDLATKVGQRGVAQEDYLSAYYYSLQWEFIEVQVGIAILLGILCAAVALCLIITMGACKQIFIRIKLRLYPISAFLGTVLPPVIGGIIIGLINMALPMTVGPGEIFFAPVAKFGFPNALSSPRHNIYDDDKCPGVLPGLLSISLLISSLFGKMFCLGISMNCGFIGGLVFPQIIMGAFLAAALSQHFSFDYKNLDDYVSNSTPMIVPSSMLLGCCCAAVPAAFIPIPYTLCLTVIFLFYFGLYQTVPIFVSVITSYTCLCGSGLMYNLFTKAAERNKAAETVIDEAINAAPGIRIGFNN
jgi:H+/Cl- antiporter ClcA